MATFKDSENRKWSPRVTLRTIDLFEDATGIGILKEAANGLRGLDLGALPVDGKDGVKAGPEMANKMLELLSAMLGGKAGNIARFAFASVHRQATDRKVEYEDFADALDGDTLAEAAPILMEEFSRFFRSAARRVTAAK